VAGELGKINKVDQAIMVYIAAIAPLGLAAYLGRPASATGGVVPAVELANKTSVKDTIASVYIWSTQNIRLTFNDCFDRAP
jgi:hypothetical protein